MGTRRAVRPSPLVLQIAARIVERARRLNLQPGAHLPKHHLALEFHVSRSPVRDALELLRRKGVVDLSRNRGYFLAVRGDALERRAVSPLVKADEASYLKVAGDRLAGKLPEQFKEADLMRRYGLARGELAGMLRRMAQEGWIERKPGYGWNFVPVLTSAESHAQSYRFRAAIEPAALLEPSYRVDRVAFARLRAEQQGLIAGRIRELSSAELFQIGSHFHETVIGCCSNPFFLDALQRVNRLRRLIEYRAMVDTALFLQQAREHVRLLDLLEEGDCEAASELLRRHLDTVRAVKSSVLRTRGRTPRRAAPETAIAAARGAVKHLHF